MPEPFVSQPHWWQIAIDLAIAIGTIGAVLVALFGQSFRAKFFPPVLSLSIDDIHGEAIRVGFVPQNAIESKHEEEARYYHLRVHNARRWSPATDTRIVLLQVEEPGPDGQMQLRWKGDIPLAWRHDTVFPPFRVVGPDSFADLCSVVKGKWLQLHVLISPFNLETIHRHPTTMVVSIQAQSTQVNSNILRIQISWDGGFDPGTQEMRKHLIIQEL